MNKTSIILVGILIVLGVVAYIVTRPAQAPEPKTIQIAGYATEDQLEQEKKRDLTSPVVAIEYPVDEVVVTKNGESFRLVREGEGKDLAWTLAEPIQAPAVKYATEKMIHPFKDETTSVHAQAIKPEDLPRFDLEPERRLSITLKAGGSVWNGVDLVVGKVESSDSEAAQGGVVKDTWVLKAGDESMVYRIAGKDLRSPFEQSLSDLRDKKVFAGKPDDLVKVVVEPPSGPKIVLAGDRKETPAEEEGKPPKMEVTWSIQEPAGFEADNAVQSLTRNVANLRTREFIPTAKAPEDALGGERWTFTGTTHDGKEIKFQVGAEAEEEKVWAQVVGKDELLKLDKWTAKNLRKGIEDLRDKRMLATAVTKDALTRVEFAPEEGGPVVIEKGDGGWTFVTPKSAAPVDADSVLKQLADAKVARFVRSDEAAAAQAALAAPEVTATLAVGDQSWTLRFSKKLEEGDLKNHRWGSITAAGAEAGQLFAAQDYVVKRFRKTQEELRSKKVFAFSKDDLQRLEVAWPDKPNPVALERPPEGGDMVPLDVPPDKKPKKATVNTMQSTLSNLRAKKFYDDKKSAEVELTDDKAYVVTASLADGATHKLWISKKKDGTDPYATADTGPLAGQVFTINNYQALNLQKELTELVE